MAYPPIPERLQQFDHLICLEHYYISEDDDCYFLWERVTRGRYQEHPTNQLIINLQILPSLRSSSRWRHKDAAILYSANALGGLIPQPWREAGTFVPIPPSLVKDDPEHDPRLMSILKNVNPPLADIRELVLQNANAVAKQKQISPQERAANFSINPECCEPNPEHIVIFDDVLTGGSHFQGMKIVLRERYPLAKISGLMIARAIHPPTFILGGLGETIII